MPAPVVVGFAQHCIIHQHQNNDLQVASGGVVRDTRVHQEVIASVSEGIAAQGFSMQGHMLSPITGATSGNKEFLALFTRNA